MEIYIVPSPDDTLLLSTASPLHVKSVYPPPPIHVESVSHIDSDWWYTGDQQDYLEDRQCVFNSPNDEYYSWTDQDPPPARGHGWEKWEEHEPKVTVTNSSPIQPHNNACTVLSCPRNAYPPRECDQECYPPPPSSTTLSEYKEVLSEEHNTLVSYINFLPPCVASLIVLFLELNGQKSGVFQECYQLPMVPEDIYHIIP